MIEFVVVTRRRPRIPINRHRDVEGAADYIVRERKFHEWTVLAQEANQITPGTPYRELRQHEKLALEKRLFPTLYER